MGGWWGGDLVLLLTIHLLQYDNYNRGMRVWKLIHQVIYSAQACQFREASEENDASMKAFLDQIPRLERGGEDAMAVINGDIMRTLASRFEAWQQEKREHCAQCRQIGLILSSIEAMLAFVTASRTIRSATDASGRHCGLANYMVALDGLEPYVAAADRVLLSFEWMLHCSMTWRHGTSPP